MAPRAFACALLCISLATPGALAQTPPGEGQRPVYLAYAGPYSSSPSSAFGHLFLVIPERPEQPVPLWDVVSFSAETFDAGPVRYFTMGIAGGFLGRYRRLDFHEKTRDYRHLEDRNLWLLRMEMDQAERRALEDGLSAAGGKWHPYTFFQKNCAYYLQRILARVFPAIPPPQGAVSPTEVVQLVLESGLVGPAYFLPSGSTRLEETSRGVSDGVLGRLRGEPWAAVAADTAWLKALPVLERRFVQSFFMWKSLRRRSALGQDSRRGLAVLRRLNAVEARGRGGFDAGVPLGEPVPPPRFHSYPRLTISYLRGAFAAERVSLGYRAGLHDQLDPWISYRPLNTLELLAVETSSPTGSFVPRLDRLILFSQRSLDPSSWIQTRSSWLLEALARRGGLFGGNGLHLEARGGLGRTVRLSTRVFAYGLVTGAVVGRWDHRATFAAGVEAGLTMLAARDWRWAVRWIREHDVDGWWRRHQRITAWIRHDVGPGWGIRLSGEAGPPGNRVVMGVDWYP